MALTITAHGDIDQIVVSSLARTFVQKIYRHCWGKNNTPYFAGNCFKACSISMSAWPRNTPRIWG